MDPLTAISLAASIVSFVQLAVSLFDGTQQIYNSASGSSDETERLEFIYTSLFSLSSKLSLGTERKAIGIRLVASGLPKDAPSLGVLATRCGKDCDELLRIVEQMKLKTRDMITNVDAQIKALRFETQSLKDQRSQQLSEISLGVASIQRQITTITSNQDRKHLSSDEIESLTTKVSELSLRSQEYAKENELLASLNYKQRPARHESIINAHKSTLKWIFSATDTTSNQSGRLADWLENGHGIFWVSGKPGSGKSTFMKFVASHPQTDNLLAMWAAPKTVIKACHYFWSPGTDTQRSQEGLLRSILFDILCSNSQLIPLVCPDRWSSSNSVNMSTSIPWSLTELQGAVKRIAGETDLPVRFCFFIDGLDEFSGDHLLLCESLLELSKSPRIKLLVSSRPWNAFEDNLGRDTASKLYLHELTGKDIQYYVESQLFQHSNWDGLVSEAGEKQANALIEEITVRSRGVFLWVFLVTRLLRDGLTNYDTVLELQKRLENIPSDLGAFFKLMLESVEPFYHNKMAGTLHLALAAKEPLPIILYSFQDLEYSNPSYAFKEKVNPWSRTQMEAFQAPFSRRLNSRCKGLLEIQGKKVEFLHRTVRDFLNTAEMRDFIASKAPQDFDPSFSIFQAYVAWIKHKSFFGGADTAGVESDLQEHVTPVLDQALFYASYGSAEKNALSFDLVDDLEWSIHSHFIASSSNEQSQVSGPTKHRSIAVFRHCLLGASLADYISKKLNEDKTFLDVLEIPPLSTVLGMERSFGFNALHNWSDQHLNLLRELLIRGHDPNQAFTWGQSTQPRTPWSDLIRKLTREDKWLPAIDAGVISLLLEHGADPNIIIQHNSYKGSNSDMITKSVPMLMPAWVCFFTLAFWDLHISVCTGAYIQALDTMLAKVDFDGHSESLQAIINNSKAVQSLDKWEPSSTMREAAFEMVINLLQQTSKQSTYQTFQLIAKAIGVLITHTAQMSTRLIPLQAYVCELFPPSLSRYLSDIIDGLSSGSTNFKVVDGNKSSNDDKRSGSTKKLSKKRVKRRRI
ncbi:hypothetical protein BP6252_14036 [Coleophoma cylindrospora]|uniref:Uncharacterized protein n=1 Tax=Coleophoma cylindrospora TaxID=1849047 RepID=A0A3D8Q5J8_9HELO|nr:hypothetical protein BP6252_14036 [Coleophoma cylindrospora]